MQGRKAIGATGVAACVKPIIRSTSGKEGSTVSHVSLASPNKPLGNRMARRIGHNTFLDIQYAYNVGCVHSGPIVQSRHAGLAPRNQFLCLLGPSHNQDRRTRWKGLLGHFPRCRIDSESSFGWPSAAHEYEPYGGGLTRPTCSGQERQSRDNAACAKQW
jgi:hypothetical protein